MRTWTRVYIKNVQVRIEIIILTKNVFIGRVIMFCLTAIEAPRLLRVNHLVYGNHGNDEHLRCIQNLNNVIGVCITLKRSPDMYTRYNWARLNLSQLHMQNRAKVSP